MIVIEWFGLKIERIGESWELWEKLEKVWVVNFIENNLIIIIKLIVEREINFEFEIKRKWSIFW